jgi:hypothetical protein
LLQLGSEVCGSELDIIRRRESVENGSVSSANRTRGTLVLRRLLTEVRDRVKAL